MAALRGVNLPCFFNAYGCDLAPNAVLGSHPEQSNPMRIYRPLLRARELGFEAVHLSLCEGGEGILLDNGAIRGVHPVLVESIAIIQECASLCGLRLYWTLLDGHSMERCGDSLTSAILSRQDETARFAERVAAGIVRRLDPKLTLAVEVVNEPEALIAKDAASSDRGWDNMRSAIGTIADAIRSERAASIVTAGASMSALAALWQGAPRLGAIDIHIEEDAAGLPSRSEILRTVANAAPRMSTLPLIAGSASVTQSSDGNYGAVFCRADFDDEAG
jgi:hypothetical protein